MSTPAEQSTELTRRHKQAANFVNALITLTLVLVALAFALNRYSVPRDNPTLDMAWRIGVIIFGLCAVALRRTKFAPLRLQDIAALRGLSGLLQTLRQTTVQVALLGGVIAVAGFIVTMLTGYVSYAVVSGLAALLVLLYCYPRRAAWQRVAQGIKQMGDANAPSVKGTAA